MDSSSTPPKQDNGDVKTGECNKQSDMENHDQNTCTDVEFSKCVTQVCRKIYLNDSEVKPKIPSNYDRLSVLTQDSELDPHEVEKLFSILFESDASSFTSSSGTSTHNQNAFKPVRRFSPYPIHQQLFIQQQQEQERRRQSLMPSTVSQTVTDLREKYRNLKWKYSDAFRTRTVQRVIGFIDTHSSRMFSCVDNCSENCVICMCNYHPNQELRQLRCSHKFHRKCIDEWLVKSYICPVCRKDLADTGKIYKGMSVFYHMWKYSDNLNASSQGVDNHSTASHTSKSNREQGENVINQVSAFKHDWSDSDSESDVSHVEVDHVTATMSETQESTT